MHFGKRLIAQIIEKSIDNPLADKIFDKVYKKFMEEVDANVNGIATHDGKAIYAVTNTLASRVAKTLLEWSGPRLDKAQCGNFMIFLSLRFYMKSILGIGEFQNLAFLQFLFCKLSDITIHGINDWWNTFSLKLNIIFRMLNRLERGQTFAK